MATSATTPNDLTNLFWGPSLVNTWRPCWFRSVLDALLSGHSSTESALGIDTNRGNLPMYFFPLLGQVGNGFPASNVFWPRQRFLCTGGGVSGKGRPLPQPLPGKSAIDSIPPTGANRWLI